MSIKVGIVGWGGIAVKLHAPCLTGMKEFDLIAVCDTSAPKVQRAERECTCEGYRNFDSFLNHPKLEMVVITTPNHLHGPMAIRALELGKHVVVEKPMCIRLSEAERMLEIARNKGLIVTIHQNRRWDNDFLAVKQMIDDGRIGKPLVIQSRFLAGPYAKTWGSRKEFTGGGAFLSYGPHLIDQILTIAPSGSVYVFGMVKSIRHEEDYFNCSLTFEDGLSALIEMSRGNRLSYYPRFHVAGESGDLMVTATKNGDSWLKLKTDAGIQEKQKLPEQSAFHLQSQPFYQNVSAAIMCRQALIVAPEHGRRYVAIAEAISESFRQNNIVLVKGTEDDDMNQKCSKSN
jgi:predicted dehydrogenase